MEKFVLSLQESPDVNPSSSASTGTGDYTSHLSLGTNFSNGHNGSVIESMELGNFGSTNILYRDSDTFGNINATSFGANENSLDETLWSASLSFLESPERERESKDALF